MERLNVTIQQNYTKIINFDDVTKGNITEHNSNWPQISDHLYRILIIESSRCGKTSHQLDIDKVFIYAQDSYDAKCQLLIKKRESTGSKHLNDSKTFIEYSNDMNDIYKNNEKYNPNKKR